MTIAIKPTVHIAIKVVRKIIFKVCILFPLRKVYHSWENKSRKKCSVVEKKLEGIEMIEEIGIWIVEKSRLKNCIGLVRGLYNLSDGVGGRHQLYFCY